jgi:hypothetical protein
MSDIKKFYNFQLNEDVQDEEQEGIFAKNDGWNKNELDNIGLLEWLDEVYRFSYEVKTCRRGSYAINGDTDRDLLEALQVIQENLRYIVENIEEKID